MKTTLILFLSLVTLTVHAAPAAATASKRKAGWRESYGGDATVSEFVNIAQTITETIRDNKLSVIDEETLQLMEENIESATIACGENLVLDGISKDAINYPLEKPGRIVFDCNKWNSEKYSPSNKVRLVAHEFLFLAGIDDSDYDVSSKIVRHYFTYRPSSNVSTKLLYNVIMSCDLATFNMMVEEGADVRAKFINGMDSIHASFAYECWSITSELVAMGVKPEKSLSSETNSIVILIQKAANLFQSYDKYRYNKAMSLLAELVSQHPELLSEKFVRLPQSGNNDQYIFNNNNALCENTPITFMVAAGLVRINSSPYIGKKEIINRPVIMDNEFLETLVELGFSLEDEDSCGRSALSFR